MARRANATPRDDHDQRFKTIIKRMLRAFIELVLPDWADGFDFETVTWLDKEPFPDPPRGLRPVMDLVAKVRFRDTANGTTETIWIFILIEIESSDSVAELRTQIFRYYQHLTGTLGLDVLPIALLLNVGLDGVGWESVQKSIRGRRIGSVDFAYLGLPALDAADYVVNSNVFGAALSALMKIEAERRAWLKASALQRIATSEENEFDRFLLGEIVDTYLKLTPTQTAEFEALVATPKFEEAKIMTTTWHQQGKAEGRAEGKAEGKAEALLRLGRKKFGKMPGKAVREKIIGTTDPALLDRWLENLLDAGSWNDVLD